MDKDSTKWVRQVITHFVQMFPQAESLPIAVSWTKKEDTKGYAVGSLKAGNASVPLIIREWRLAPMDTMIVNDKPLPLTTEMLSMLMIKAQPFKGLVNHNRTGIEMMFGGMQMSPTGYPTQDTSEGFNRPAKVASFIENLSSIDKRVVKDLLEKVAADQSITYGFVQNETTEVLDRLVKSATSVESSQEAFLRDLDVDRQLVVQDREGNHHVKQACAGFDHTWSKQIPSSDVDKFPTLSAKLPEIVKVGDVKEEKVIAHNSSPEAGKIGCWYTEDGTTEHFEITGVTKVANEDKYNIYQNNSRFLCVDEDQNWFEHDSSEVKTAENFKINGDFPNIGSKGVFVLRNQTTPQYELRNMTKEAGKFTKISAWTGTGVHYLHLTDNDSDEFIVDGVDVYLPKTAKFIALKDELKTIAIEKQAELAENAHRTDKIAFLTVNGFKQTKYVVGGDKLEKIAEDVYRIPEGTQFLEVSPEKIAEVLPTYTDIATHRIDKDSYGYYSLNGPEFSKYAAQGHKIRDLSHADAKWALISCDSTLDVLDKIADAKFTTLDVNNVKAPVPVQAYLDKIAEKYENGLEEIFNVEKTHLLKCAASLTDKSTVDAILSLGVINKKNAGEFMAMLPSYEAVMSDLASLLIMSRVGMKQVSELAIKEAMEAITTVVLMLQRLNATN
jgi:hypothetical protein